jgi:hypothetical protein
MSATKKSNWKGTRVTGRCNRETEKKRDNENQRAKGEL